ncbi:unnamed protein product [Haemonchus placei]|uniref:FH2 domain-containing protein n=1 Tax=Haemonchus placei TaxID=6290 RepID=A0A0N4VTE8_HAEPC|nr:unnamed protein product [Haemonchus placei]
MVANHPSPFPPFCLATSLLPIYVVIDTIYWELNVEKKRKVLHLKVQNLYRHTTPSDELEKELIWEIDQRISGLMKVISEKDSPDPETLVYGMTVINKTLRGIPDSDTYYDAVDTLEMLGMEEAMKSMVKLGNNELLEQCRLYERELSKEDERAENSDDDVNARMRYVCTRNIDGRGGFRFPSAKTVIVWLRIWFCNELVLIESRLIAKTLLVCSCVCHSFRASSQQTMHESDRRSVMRRRHQEARQRQEEHIAFAQSRNMFAKEKYGLLGGILRVPVQLQSLEPSSFQVKAPPPSFPTIFSPTESKTIEFPEPVFLGIWFTRPETIERDDGGGGFAALLQKRAAKSAEANRNAFAQKESEADIQWKKAAENLKSRPLIINDLDFSEFHAEEFEQDPLVMARLAQMAQDKGILPGGRMNGGVQGQGGGPPPPPPPLPGGVPPPPPPNFKRETSPGKNFERFPFIEYIRPSGTVGKGVLKLHWKPTSAEPPPVPSLKQKGSFWNKLDRPQIDANKLVQLFEAKHNKEVAVKKPVDAKPAVLQVLSMKRSQAISIVLTKLPPINVIPTAIMKFDSMVLNKDGIEKILKTMMPTAKEVEEIQEKQLQNPDMQLVSSRA